MEKNDMEKRVIESYQHDERMMILIYAQWCVNNEINPKQIYERTYPGQLKNVALTDALELTVSKKESEEIPDQTVLNVLQLFGNDDLAFAVQQEIEKRESR